MAKYFIDREIYFQGKQMPPKKVIITQMEPEMNGKTVLCYDKDGNDYSIDISEIRDDDDNPIKDVRLLLKMSQKQFSEFIGMPSRTLEDWEAKKYTPADYILNLIIEKAFSIL